MIGLEIRFPMRDWWSSMLPRGTRARDINEFNSLLVAWLADNDAQTIGSGVDPRWASVVIGETDCWLQADTSRRGVQRWLDLALRCEGRYSVVGSSKGVVHRVTPGSQSERIRGFYLYTSDPLEEPQLLAGQPAGAFDLFDVALLVLRTVELLHQRGFGRLRIYPGLSGSGFHWRVAVIAADNLVRSDGHTSVRDHDQAFTYTTGSEYVVGTTRVTSETTVDDLAEHVLAGVRGSLVGEPDAYTHWYAGLLSAVHRLRRLPIAYSDWDDTLPGWRLEGSVRVLLPPGELE